VWDDTTDGGLRAWLDAVDARWGSTRVPRLTRHHLGRALEQDLREAVAAGAAGADLTATDPAEFADQLAAAHGRGDAPAGWSRPVTPALLATTTVGGAVAGALVVWFVVWPLLFARIETLSDSAAVAIAYPVAGVTVLLGSVIALRVRFGDAAGLRQRVVPAVAGLVVGALLGLPATLAISAALDYPTQASYVVIESVPVVVLGLGGAFLGPWLVSSWSVVRREVLASR
jgi:hypothetical protein